MGIFDKLTGAAKKASTLTEGYAQKAKETFSSMAAPMSQEKGSSQEKTYIPNTYSLLESVPTGTEDLAPWESIIGTSKEFTLAGKTLRIPEGLDCFNSYRILFRDLAIKYTTLAENEYQKEIHNFVTFIEVFPKIYDTNLYPIVKRAVDILVAENVWTLTLDSFSIQHKTNFHAAVEYYDSIVSSANLMLETNQKMTANMMSFASGLFGNKATSNALTSGIRNSLKEEMEKQAVNKTGITLEQQADLYGRIDSKQMLECIFADYRNVLLTLIVVLNKAGHRIWLPTPEFTQQAKNVFQNLSNLNFPKDKVTDAFIDVLITNPYDVDYSRFMVSLFGENKETTEIMNYFGYEDLDDPRKY